MIGERNFLDKNGQDRLWRWAILSDWVLRRELKARGYDFEGRSRDDLITTLMDTDPVDTGVASSTASAKDEIGDCLEDSSGKTTTIS